MSSCLYCCAEKQSHFTFQFIIDTNRLLSKKKNSGLHSRKVKTLGWDLGRLRNVKHSLRRPSTGASGSANPQAVISPGLSP